MLPVLFSLGPITVYTFGFFLAVGFFLAGFIIWRRLKDLGFKEEKIIDGIIVLAVGGLLASRVFFIFQNFEKFAFIPARWIFLGRYPGLSFWGGITGITLALGWFCKKQKWNFWQVADEITFGVLPFLALAQLGAFFDGTSSGKPTSMPWGIFFPGSLLRQHPVSLFMAILLFLISLFLLKIERQWRFWSWYKSKSPGFIFLTFLGLMFFVNFLLAFLRETKLYFYWLGIILSLLGTAASSALIWQKRK